MIRIRIKHPSTTPSRELCSPSRSVLYPEGEVGSSDCFISSVEHVIPWASTTRAGPPRPGTEFAVCWCSELARVGVDLARDGQMDRVVVFPGAGPSRKVSKASLSRKSGRNRSWGRPGSVQCRSRFCSGSSRKVVPHVSTCEPCQNARTSSE